MDSDFSPENSEFIAKLDREMNVGMTIGLFLDLYKQQEELDSMDLGSDRYLWVSEQADCSVVASFCLELSGEKHRIVIESPEWPVVDRAKDINVVVYSGNQQEPPSGFLSKLIEEGRPVPSRYIQ